MISDDALPTWLHTLLCFGVGVSFAVPLLFLGLQAIFKRRLEPLSGPELGQYFFGPNPISGTSAQVAGLALIVYGLAFLALALAFTRFAEDRKRLRWLPWVLLLLGVGTSFLVRP